MTRINCLALLTCAAVSLNGCTTVSSGVAVAPPGVSPFSFRECLLNSGFYSRQALTGIPRDDWKARHARTRDGKLLHPVGSTPTREELIDQSSAEFVARSAAIIADGLMPSVEFVSPGSSAGSGAYDDDLGLNRPYAPMRAPDPYPAAGAPAAEPGSGRLPGPDWRLNRFLDCYVGQVGPISATGTTDGDVDIEGRLLRGHILLAMMARFGTELVVSRPSSRQVAQAELLLGHVADAEKSLRGSSMIMNDAARSTLPPGILTLADADGAVVYAGDMLVRAENGVAKKDAAGKPIPAGDLRTVTWNDVRGDAQPGLRWYGFTTRLLRVFQVGVDIERIDVQQTLDRASNLIAAFGGALNGFLPILKDSLSGFVTVQKTRIYGDAYLRDARETLRVARGGTSRPDAARETMRYDVGKMRRSWQIWDAELDKACKLLATVAKKDDASAECVPDLDLPAKQPAR
jgi:hypothetical protein